MYKKCLKGKSMCTASSDHRPRQRVWFCLRKFTLLKILLYYPFINWKNDLQKRRKMKIHQTGKEFFTKAPVFFKKAKIIQKPTTSQPGEPGDVLPIEVPWSFWSSPLLVLSALWITTAVISPTFQRVLFLWWKLGRFFHRFLGTTDGLYTRFKVVVSPLKKQYWRAWLLRV